jgi:lipopolysaccharide/colanic/teichoic acid biosynthesis glycosyltransferase
MKILSGNADDILGRLGLASPGPAAWYKRRAPFRFEGENVHRCVKRGLDLLFCAASLPFALPLLALCAIAIRIDSPGPVYFSQQRTGENGRRFRMFKLRTMVQDAEEIKDKYRELNVLSYPDFKIKDDPRITRVGKWLRKSSLDELPQIFNILRGDMTVVGPRPTSFCSSTYALWQTARLEATPGLTGLWQVSGRSELDFDERSRLDIAYIRHRSIRLDLEIMVRTVGCVFSGRGAG